MCALLNVYGYRRPHPWEWSLPTWFSLDLLRDWLLGESLVTCSDDVDTQNTTSASTGASSSDVDVSQDSDACNSQSLDVADSNIPTLQSGVAMDSNVLDLQFGCTPGTPDLSAPPSDVATIVDQILELDDERKVGANNGN